MARGVEFLSTNTEAGQLPTEPLLSGRAGAHSDSPGRVCPGVVEWGRGGGWWTDGWACSHRLHSVAVSEIISGHFSRIQKGKCFKMKQIKSILGAELTKEGIPRPCCWGSLEGPRQPPLPTSARLPTPLLWLLPPQHRSGWTGWSLRRALACPPAPSRARVGGTRNLLFLLIPSPSITVESPPQVQGSRAGSPGADLLWVSLRGHVSARYHAAGSWVGHVLQLQRVPGPWGPGCPALGAGMCTPPVLTTTPGPQWELAGGQWLPERTSTSPMGPSKMGRSCRKSHYGPTWGQETSSEWGQMGVLGVQRVSSRASKRNEGKGVVISEISGGRMSPTKLRPGPGLRESPSETRCTATACRTADPGHPPHMDTRTQTHTLTHTCPRLPAVLTLLRPTVTCGEQTQPLGSRRHGPSPCQGSQAARAWLGPHPRADLSWHHTG